jgi:hypothetical protein
MAYSSWGLSRSGTLWDLRLGIRGSYFEGRVMVRMKFSRGEYRACFAGFVIGMLLVFVVFIPVLADQINKPSVYYVSSLEAE